MVFDPSKVPTPLPAPPAPGTVTIYGTPLTQGQYTFFPNNCRPPVAPFIPPFTLKPNPPGQWKWSTLPPTVLVIVGTAAGFWRLSIQDIVGNVNAFYIGPPTSPDPSGTYTVNSPCSAPASFTVVLNP